MTTRHDDDDEHDDERAAASEDPALHDEEDLHEVPICDDEDDDFQEEDAVQHDQLPTVEEVRIYASSLLAQTPDGYTRRRNCALGLLLIVFVAALIALVGISAAMSKQRSSGDDSSQVATRLTATIDFLLSVSGADALLDYSTPQHRAALWIARDDVAQLPVPAEPMTPHSDKNAAKFIQRYALAVLYYATGGEEWTDGYGFLSETDECHWYTTVESLYQDDFYLYGASCHGDWPYDSVSQIWMPNNNLKGTLPPEIQQFTSIQVLSLEDNDSISGSIPKGITQLTNLRLVLLDGNSLTGTIPDGIGSLERLLRLRLDRNWLTGIIPQSLGNPTSSELISLHDNNLGGIMPSSVCDLALEGGLIELTSDCGGSNPKVSCPCCSECYPVEDKEKRLVHVTEFLLAVSDKDDLSAINSPQHRAAAWIAQDDRFRLPVPSSSTGVAAEKFSQRYSLAVLYFAMSGDFWKDGYNFLSAKDECLWYTTIESFYQDSFYLHGASCQGGSFDRVTQIWMPENNLKGTIPSEVRQFAKIEVFSLEDNNHITGTLPEEVAELDDLRILSLNGNRMVGALPTEIGKLQFLKKFHAHDNHFSGAVPEHICGLARADLTELTTDCAGSNPKVTCTCCSKCYPV